MKMTMTMDRYRELLEAYGSDSNRWPDAERAPAISFERDNFDAVKQLKGQAQRLDVLLDQADRREPSAALAARVLASAPTPKIRSSLFGDSWHLAGGAVAVGRGAMFAALVLAAGVSVGYAGGSAAVEAAAGNAVLAQAFPDADTTLYVEG